ncbi:hypothetical protein I6B53_01880 [Schaalia sp. 19OD2882]|uniref:hypothetical protein n=1 Tax=Schaalia sp. 19OD2882 TaxID=2794089 RepID=UPI001C1EA1D9|nr:hypothetical protein [Schaalia sp. 19OD2882]QWW19898.1 hypothetical protein I6B53_01880 [Schaalia sp. 19OD2882]
MLDRERKSTFIAWTRRGETPEQIARMIFAYVTDFSARTGAGPWEAIRNQWDGTLQDLARIVRERVLTDDSGIAHPEGGYSLGLSSHDDRLNTKLSANAGETEILPFLTSPSLVHTFFASTLPLRLLWDASIRAGVATINPAFAYGQDRTLKRLARRERREN